MMKTFANVRNTQISLHTPCVRPKRVPLQGTWILKQPRFSIPIMAGTSGKPRDLVSRCIEQKLIVRTFRLKAAKNTLSAKHRSDLAAAVATLSRLRTEFFVLHPEYTDHFPELYTATTAPPSARTAGTLNVPQR
jgi:hypothetical protein